MQLKLQQTGEGAGEKVQRLKSGPIQLREHTPTEKHAGLEASRWQAPPLDSSCDRPVTHPVDSKHY